MQSSISIYLFFPHIPSSNKEIWDTHIAKDLENELAKDKYLCGDQFTAADVLVMYT